MADSHAVPYRRIYVWELPVRLFHWVNALCIVVLMATGYLIGNPQAIFHSNEAYQQGWFGWVRFAHFAAAYLFFFNFLGRIYWSFAGNRFSRWRNFIPSTRAQWKEIAQVFKVDVMMTRLHGRMSIGHNAVAGLVYFLSFVAFLFQAATGFALYAPMSDWWLPSLFTWVVPLMGGEMAVRQWHHLLMWFFIVFVIVHVYLVWYHDHVEGRGTTSSIISGWKFVKHDDLEP